MPLDYPRIYALLKNSGHTPLKALEILLDAERGDPLALIWIKGLFRMRGGINA